ncbi:hypothetical protein [Nocardia barduliensis]|uniref:hypothetical protein n=1 Tax=Nocardia barduliensis TaxID=2736643 RepID=UPI001573EE95|nr:hypothetical protein [Nocardia barduliensis]
MTQLLDGSGLYQILNPQAGGAAMGLTGADTGGRGVAVGLVAPDRNDGGQVWLVEVSDPTVDIFNQQTNTMLLVAGTQKDSAVVCGGGEIYGAMSWCLDGGSDAQSSVLVPVFTDDLAVAPEGLDYGLTLVDNTRDGTQLWHFVRL